MFHMSSYFKMLLDPEENKEFWFVNNLKSLHFVEAPILPQLRVYLKPYQFGMKSNLADARQITNQNCLMK